MMVDNLPRSRHFYFPVMEGWRFPQNTTTEDSFMSLRDLPAKKLLLLFLALVIIGVLISFFFPVSWWLSSIVRSFGEALAVGSVIVILLERFVSHRLIQETADKVSGKLVGFRLPKD